MERFATQTLQTWLSEKRRKPLVIRGARQVGKSTLVRNFAANSGRRLVEINLEKHPLLDPVFKTLDMNKIIPALEALSGNTAIDASVILFLDEIQATPHALAALRYFHEERSGISVVAAGSLLEFVLTEHQFSMPVGRVQYLHLGPMSFLEFLMAAGENNLVAAIKSMTPAHPLDDFVHQKILSELRRFAFIGGMPEAIMTYLESKSFAKVREVQDAVMGSYKDDFAKYGSRADLLLLHQILIQAAKEVGRKLKYSRLLPAEQSRTTKRLLDLLVHARVLSRIVHSNANGIPIGADTNLKAIKLLFLDIGLLNAITGLPWHEIDSEERFMQVNNGQIAEQIVGQELIATPFLKYEPTLFYWLREGRQGNSEVDFVVQIDGRIIPIEVKAGATGALKSLRYFLDSKSSPVAVRFSPRALSQEKWRGASNKETLLLNIPIYAVSELMRLMTNGFAASRGHC